ncbi:MAG: right-handed parallel beta-helix repeat-containing protein [Lentimicrobiaceae bacterium]|jgi:hypothetical protein
MKKLITKFLLIGFLLISMITLGQGTYTYPGNTLTGSFGTWGGTGYFYNPTFNVDASGGIDVTYYDIDVSLFTEANVWSTKGVAIPGVSKSNTMTSIDPNNNSIFCNILNMEIASGTDWDGHAISTLGPDGTLNTADDTRHQGTQDWYRQMTGGKIDGPADGPYYNNESYIIPNPRHPDATPTSASELNKYDFRLRILPTGYHAYTYEMWVRMHNSAAEIEGANWVYNIAMNNSSDAWKKFAQGATDVFSVSNIDLSSVHVFMGLGNFQDPATQTLTWGDVVVTGTRIPAPITTIQTPSPTSCGTYDVPVTVKDFSNVANASLKLNYDPLVFAYQSVTINPTFTSGIVSGNTGGQFSFSYVGGGITLPDNAVLFTLHFNLLPSVSGATTNLTWGTGSDCEYSAPSGTPIYVSTFNNLEWTIPARSVVNASTGYGFCTIQEAIDHPLTVDGNIIKVYPGTYNQDEANNRNAVTGGVGTSNFNIFVNKSVTIQGVDASGNPITNASSVLANIIPKRNTPSGNLSSIFIQADVVTISGFDVTAFTDSDNNFKTISVIGNNVTIKNCKLHNLDQVSCIYVYDPRYNLGTNTSYLQSYRFESNILDPGGINASSIRFSSGAGWSGVVADRIITGNTINGGSYGIEFVGPGADAWDVYPVGAATITGNTFSGLEKGHVTAWGEYASAPGYGAIDWSGILSSNTFDKVVINWQSDGTTIRTWELLPQFKNVCGLYSAIQRYPINKSQATDIVEVYPGTYPEQLTISKNIHVKGKTGAMTSIFVQAPPTLPIASDPLSNIILVSGFGVSAEISGLTIQGPGPTACGSMGRGIFVRDGAYANIHDNQILDIRDNVFSGCQNGIAIQIGRQAMSTTGSATIQDNLITGYQKGGIVVDNTGSTATIIDNVVTGAGTTTVTAQNGIQISSGATATLHGNTITGNSFHIAGNTWDWGACGILLYESGAVSLTGGNNLSGNDNNYYAYDVNGTLTMGAEVFGASTAPVTFGYNIVDYSNQNIDASLCTFAEGISSSATLAQLYNIEDRIWHSVDAQDRTGFVNVKDGNVYVTHTETGAKLQFGIAAATSLYNVNVKAGTYAEAITVNKSLTLLGANAGTSCSDTRVAESIISGIGAAAVTVASDGVTLNGFEITNPSGNYAVEATGRNNLSIIYNKIHNIGTLPVLSGNTHAVAIVMSSTANIASVTVKNNCFSDIKGGENPASTGAVAKANNGSAAAIGVGWSNAEHDITDLLIEGNVISNVSACSGSDFANGGKGAYGVMINVGAGSANVGKAVSPVVQNNTISGLSGLWSHAIGLEGETPGALVQKNVISGLSSTKTPADAAGVMVEDNAGAKTVGIHNNSFTGLSYGVINSTGLLVNATCNWYGSSDYNLIFPKIVGNVTFAPYLVTSNIATPACDGVVPPVYNTNGPLYYYSIQDAIDAGATVDHDVIRVAVADFTEPGLIRVTKSLTIEGLGKTATTVRCNVNTSNGGHNDDAAAWILGSTDKTMTIRDMTLDATGKNVTYGIRFRNDGEVTNVALNQIKTSNQYYGTAVQVLDGNVDVKGCTFTNIGRIGVHYRNGVIPGAVISGLYDNNSYTGKGDGDWLDYALDISGGTTVTVSNSTVTGNTGVALSDGSTSAGVMATTYFPYSLNVPNNVTITDNTLNGNTTGITVGYDANDVSVVVAHGNKIFGNGSFGVQSTGPVVDATSNWWGDASGPKNTPTNICGSGNEVTSNVTFRPWWTDEAMTVASVTSGPLQVGGPVAITSTVECAPATITFSLPVVQDACGTAITPTGPVMSGTYEGCEGTKIYTYNYTDALGQTLVWTYTYTIDHTTAPVVPAPGSSTVACASLAVAPLAGPDQQQVNFSSQVLDNNNSVGQSFTCGKSGKLDKLDISVYSYSGTPTFALKIYQGDGIIGTELCTVPGLTITGTGWQTLNIPANLAPVLTSGTQYTFWLTGYTLNSVRFMVGADSYAGGKAYDLPPLADYPGNDMMFRTYMESVVTDVCGNVIPAPTPVVSTTPACEGTITYTYNYTDCSGLITPWVYTYTIAPPALVMPTAESSTVSCPSASQIAPTAPPVLDGCGNTVNGVLVSHNSAPLCNGDVVWTYSYTACNNAISNWTYTYHVVYSGGLTVPTLGASTVAGSAQTVNPGAPANITDACGRTVVPVLVGSTTPPACDGTVVWTYRYTACDGTTTADWTYTYTVTKSTLSGTLKYNNATQDPMNNVTLTLTPGGATATTSGTGYYEFTGLCPDTYTIAVTTNNKSVGGINSTDAGAANYWGTAFGPIEHVKFLAGDVDNDHAITSSDASKIQRYFVFHENFSNAWAYYQKGEFIQNNFDSKCSVTDINVQVSGNTPDFDLYGMCTGDFNGSFTPSATKSANSSLILTNEGMMVAGSNQEFVLPIRAASAMDVSAVSMILDIPSDLLEVKDVAVNGSTDPVAWAVNGHELRIGWNSTMPVNIPANGSLLILKLRTTSAFTEGNSILLNLVTDPLNELADATYNVIENAVLVVNQVNNGMLAIPAQPGSNLLSLSNYPNPFNGSTTVTYEIPYDGKVTLEVYNMLGQKVTTLVDKTQSAGKFTLKADAGSMQPGFYSVILRLKTKDGEMVRTIRFIVNQ